MEIEVKGKIGEKDGLEEEGEEGGDRGRRGIVVQLRC